MLCLGAGLPTTTVFGVQEVIMLLIVEHNYAPIMLSWMLSTDDHSLCMPVRACVYVPVCACVRACVCVCVYMCTRCCSILGVLGME